MMHQEDFQHSIHPPQFNDRRRTDDALLALVQEALKEVKEVKAQFAYHHATYVENTANAVAKAMSDAFPDGDPHGHRKHHELVIQREEERVVFWHTMKVKLTEWGLIGFAGWAFYALWVAFLKGPVK